MPELECLLREGLLLVQAESEWRRAGDGRGAGAEAGAGRRAALDAAVVPERARGIGEGRIKRLSDGPAWVAVRRDER